MLQRVVNGLLILVDSVIIVSVSFLAVVMKADSSSTDIYFGETVQHLHEILGIRLLLFYTFRLYHRLWRYASINELLAIVGAVTGSSIIIAVLCDRCSPAIPESIHLINWLLTIMFIGASRLCLRIMASIRYGESNNCSKVLIVGAGDAGAMAARELNKHYYDTKKIVGFIDDDTYKHEKILFGSKVLGGRKDIINIVSHYKVDEIIIAMPSADGSQIREILQGCKKTQCKVQILPGIFELIEGRFDFQKLRKVDVEDLLRRKPVQLNLDQISCYIKDKTVLVTGAGGSIGSELCRQIAKIKPGNLVLLGKGENSIYEIFTELRAIHENLKMETVIADIRDKKRIDAIFAKFKPNVVFHAAAHKHVPLMEEQPVEAVRNNIFGTKNVAEAADKNGAEVFVMISTDKAVNPTSVMGATKRIAELIVQRMSQLSQTKFTAVRFGNVLGSRGSVIPLFRRQIAAGGPLTVTHPEMRRYFMTIPEAVQLVLQAGAMANGGEVFVLDMGEPIRIVDLANDLIELSGLIPGKDILIKFSGLRPGEKLFEEILSAEEGTHATKHEKIFAANLRNVNPEALMIGLAGLETANSRGDIIKYISELVPTYNPASQLVFMGEKAPKNNNLQQK